MPIPRVFPKILAAAGVSLAVINIAYRHSQMPVWLGAGLPPAYLERLVQKRIKPHALCWGF